MPKSTRREFLRNTAACGAGIAVSTVVVPSALAASAAQWPRINPAIDNLRVACCYDPAMLTGTATGLSLAKLEAVVDSGKVSDNMDAMAMTLTGETSASLAWQRIFMLPQGKQSWNQVVAAIKVNCINNSNMPRASVVGKICRVLIDLGVLPANVIIFDAASNAYSTAVGVKYNSFVGTKIPTGVTVSNGTSAVGAAVLTATPAPYSRTGATHCVSKLVNNEIDLLINCGLNKGHNQSDKGGFTSTLKNHFGTFDPRPTDHAGPEGCGSLEYMIAINKAPEILGNTPPRQQLCIVDSLWAQKLGPVGYDVEPNRRLAMGTFSPIVDYLVANRIRRPAGIMNVDALGSEEYHINDAALTTILSEFGYDAASDTIRNLDFEYVSTPALPFDRRSRSTQSLVMRVNGGRRGQATAVFAIPSGPVNTTIQIVDARGREVRTITPHTLQLASWDCRDNNGTTVASGTYLSQCRVEVNGRSSIQSATIQVR